MPLGRRLGGPAREAAGGDADGAAVESEEFGDPLEDDYDPGMIAARKEVSDCTL